ncbi:hypothetical protein EDD17DRAFT_1567075 [Pisolithus thermaeus]|nr:hypothetical protein EV401DRAFT_2042541 [Pisolithus croceorrhizus]KAI6163838.1 hypothetical protein EDD17DRAFT_1567075 [Pisolithus thermaeus]
MSESVYSILGDVLASSRNIMALAAEGKRLAVPQPETKSPKSTHLPDPLPLIQTLQKYALDTETIQRINGAYLQRAGELRDTAAVAVAQASTALSPVLGLSRAPSDERVTTIFTQVYLDTLRRWIKDIETAVSSRTSAVVMEGKGKPFNYDYVPLLELFFDENPFPSHADKAFLAKKSGMTYKQIHVWFQNRRSRTKKEGRRLRKTSSTQRTTLPIVSPCARTRRYISKMDQPSCAARARISSSDCSSALCAGTRDNSLDCQTPPHAFPTPYPSSCPYDPFPAKSGSFPSHHWLRSPSKTIRTTTVDVDALTDLFSQLNIKDNRGGTTQGFRSREPSSAALAFTTRPFPAPLPSFIPTESKTPLKRHSPLPTIPAARSCYHVPIFPPGAGLLTLVPLATPNVGGSNINVKKSMREIAPLPQGTRRVDNVCREVSLSDTSAFSLESSPLSVSSSSDIMYSAPDILHPPHHMISVH